MTVEELNKPQVKVRLDRYEADVQRFESGPVKTGGIVFYGSSGFTRWSEKWGNRPLEKCIVARDGSEIAVNHGIGGSTTEELLYYYPRLVRPWKPKALVVTSFVNDRAFGYAPAEMVELLARLFAYARTDMPGIRLYATDVRPNAKHLDGYDGEWDRYTRETNRLTAEYCAAHEDVTLIPCSREPMYYNRPEDAGDYFKVREDIFIEDKIHFTPKGYEMFTEVFLRALDDVL